MRGDIELHLRLTPKGFDSVACLLHLRLTRGKEVWGTLGSGPINSNEMVGGNFGGRGARAMEMLSISSPCEKAAAKINPIPLGQATGGKLQRRTA